MKEKPKPNWQPLIQKFKTEISDQAAEIDPSQECDWPSLTYGWAMGQKLAPDEAYEFATYIRYSTDLG